MSFDLIVIYNFMHESALAIVFMCTHMSCAEMKMLYSASSFLEIIELELETQNMVDNAISLHRFGTSINCQFCLWSGYSSLKMLGCSVVMES